MDEIGKYRDWFELLSYWLLSKVLFGLILFVAYKNGRLPAEILFQWDGNWYYKLAYEGYSFAGLSEQSTVAFPPLYSFLAYLLSFSGRSLGWSLLVIGNLASLLAFYVLFNLLKLFFSRDTCKQTLLIMMFNPLAFVWSIAYTESLFLLLSVALIILLVKKRWLWSSIIMSLIPLVRVTGVTYAVLLGSTLLKEQKISWSKRLEISFVSSMGLLIWLTYIQATFGWWRLPFILQGAWYRSFFLFPSVLYLQVFRITEFVWMNSNSSATFFSAIFSLLPYIFDVVLVTYLGFVLFTNWKRLPVVWGIFTLMYFVWVLSFPAVHASAAIPLLGGMRYLLVLFPLWLLLAMRWQRSFSTLLNVSVGLYIIYSVYFAFGLYIP